MGPRVARPRSRARSFPIGVYCQVEHVASGPPSALRGAPGHGVPDGAPVARGGMSFRYTFPAPAGVVSGKSSCKCVLVLCVRPASS